MVEIQIDTSQLAKIERAVGNLRNGVPRVLVPAINRSLESGRTAVRREIRTVYAIKQKDIPMHLHRARYASTEGHIRIDQTMLDASHFKHTGGTGRSPLFLQVKKGGGGLINRGFIPFRYSGVPYMRTGEGRLPIRKILTIGAPIMATQPSVGPAATKVMGDTFAKRVDHEIKRVMATAER